MHRNQTTHRRPFMLAGAGLLVAALALSACSREDQDAAASRVDGAAAQVEQKAGEIKTDVGRNLEQAKQAGSDAADRLGDRVADASITTAVNAELAKDPDLSALAIDVDTVDGRVQLIGKAPNQAARERASLLAAAVNGVRAVDNQLVVTL
jgi:hyperosmotically inducible protein